MSQRLECITKLYLRKWIREMVHTFSSCLSSSQIGIAAPSVCCGWFTSNKAAITSKEQQQHQRDIFRFSVGRIVEEKRIVARDWQRGNWKGNCRESELDVDWTLVYQRMMAGHRCTLPLMSEGRSWIAGHAGLWWAGCCGPEASVERNENPAEREKSSRMRSLEQGRSSQHGRIFISKSLSSLNFLFVSLPLDFLLAFVRSFARSFVFFWNAVVGLFPAFFRRSPRSLCFSSSSFPYAGIPHTNPLQRKSLKFWRQIHRVADVSRRLWPG